MLDKDSLEILGEKIEFKRSMKDLTTMRIGGEAEAFVSPLDIESLRRLINAFSGKTPYHVLGGGSNVLVLDEGVKGAVISLAKGFHSFLIEEHGERFTMIAEAGCPLKRLIRESLRVGATGGEFVAGIPGTIGGALRMNAGAHGKTMADITRSLRIMDANGELKDLSAKELQFEYRRLLLPPGAIVIQGTFVLEKGEPFRSRARIREIINWRKEHQPLRQPSAGSVFKNPECAAAGRLLEESGMKGKGIGGAKFSEIHGNFIVNTGEATSDDVLRLIEMGRNAVHERTGIWLELEIEILGGGV